MNPASNPAPKFNIFTPLSEVPVRLKTALLHDNLCMNALIRAKGRQIQDPDPRIGHPDWDPGSGT